MTTPTSNNPIGNSGFLLALGAAALFSIKAIFIKLAYCYGVDVETFILLRMALALPFYIATLLLLCSRGQWQPESDRNLLTAHQAD